jgi:uncharacterized iron-regulated membrane protein
MKAFKELMLFLHRWLGIVTGLAVFIVSITGCIYCFQDDIQDLIYPYRMVKIEDKQFIKPSTLKSKAMDRFPLARVTMVIYYGNERSAQVRLLNQGKSLIVYYNPYSGSYLYDEEMKATFFSFIKEVHLHLFLPPAIGKLVNGICVIIFIVTIITGIILWWPKRKIDRKRSFKIKWGAKWKRLNYDLHNVIGFYVSVVAIILSISALSFSFQWVRQGLYNTANLWQHPPVESKTFTSDTLKMASYADSTFVVDKIYQTVKVKSPHASSFLIFTGLTQDNPVTVSAYPKALHFSYYDRYVFDRYSGKLLNFRPYALENPGTKLNVMNYDIHTGQIGGMFGKIIAFLGSLISASLPVTGLIIYLGKKK